MSDDVRKGQLLGHNQLILNTATMKEIVQYWLDSKALATGHVGTVVVTDFQQTTDTRNAPTFTVMLSDQPSS